MSQMAADINPLLFICDICVICVICG